MAHLRGGTVRHTLLDYFIAGFRHLEIRCRMPACSHAGRVEIAGIVGRRRNLPVDFLDWRCSKCTSKQVNIDPVFETRCEACARARLRVVKD